MAQINIGGRDYEIAPYKLGALRKAAPIIDRLNSTAGGLSTLEGLADSSCDLLAVLSIGLVKLDPALTPETLEEMVGLDELPAVRDCFQALLRESGMSKQGEAQAPAPASAPAGASSEASETSSTS